MEPVKVAPYFGTVEKPECHLLYNVTTIFTGGSCAGIWRNTYTIRELPRAGCFAA